VINRASVLYAEYQKNADSSYMAYLRNSGITEDYLVLLYKEFEILSTLAITKGIPVDPLRAFKTTDVNEIKRVIVGLRPSIGCNGIAFSNMPYNRFLYKGVISKSDYNEFKDLLWVRDTLYLNLSLSYRVKTNDNETIWWGFTIPVLQRLHTLGCPIITLHSESTSILTKHNIPCIKMHWEDVHKICLTQ